MYLAKMRDVEIPMLGGILQSNRAHADHAIQKVLASGKRKIGMIGLSFKPGTDDLRESPLVLIAEQFIGKGLSLSIYDPEVHLSRLLGANRRFIEQHIPHLGDLLTADLERIVADSEVLVVGLNDRETLEKLRGRVRPDQLIIDLVRIGDRSGLDADVQGLCW
jgi:GDP-mannose 6-dehydrogenase